MSILAVIERNLNDGGFLLSLKGKNNYKINNKNKKLNKKRYNACLHNTRPWKLCHSANVIKDQPMLRCEQPSHPVGQY